MGHLVHFRKTSTESGKNAVALSAVESNQVCGVTATALSNIILLNAFFNSVKAFVTLFDFGVGIYTEHNQISSMTLFKLKGKYVNLLII